MKCLIVGGGVIGLATALALQSDGHHITVCERRDRVGRETSLANGSLLTSALVEPWNSPDALGQLARSLRNPSSAMALRARHLHRYLRWGPRFLWHSTARRRAGAAVDNFGLASLSLSETARTERELGLGFARRESGSLKVLRSTDGLRHATEAAQQLAEHGLAIDVLSPADVVRVEPALAPLEGGLAGGVFFPDDQVGDAHLFCREAERVIVERGGVVQTAASVTKLVIERQAVRGAIVNGDRVDSDLVVVAAAHGSRGLLGRRLWPSIAPVKGYTLTIAGDPDPALPTVPVIDDDLHAVITPIATGLRVAGTAEFAGYDQSIPQHRIANLAGLLDAIYPTLAPRIDVAGATPWTGTRAVSSDGRPAVGATTVGGLYVNLGHGPLGWTMACGSARLLADDIAGRRPALDPAPFRPTR